MLAVDWSGRRTGAAETIWLATVEDGKLVDLSNGRDRGEVIEEVVRLAGGRADAVIGLDFAFAFPRWFCEQECWGRVEDVWRAMEQDGDDILQACREPFWGRPGVGRPAQAGPQHRRTEIEDAGRAKSVFQIGGAGAVGTGSIRGMPHLLRLAEAGFAVWPFHEPEGRPAVVEIYPRLLTGAVNKSRWRARHVLLRERFGSTQDAALLERAAGSEDAFDAAVSALAMSEATGSLPADHHPDHRIEGRIWAPAPA